MHTGVNKNSFSATFNLWPSTRSDAEVADIGHMLDADSWSPSNHVTPRSSDPTAPICQLASTPKMEILCFQDLIIARISYRYDNRKLKNISACPLLTIPNQTKPTNSNQRLQPHQMTWSVWSSIQCSCTTWISQTWIILQTNHIFPWESITLFVFNPFVLQVEACVVLCFFVQPPTLIKYCPQNNFLQHLTSSQFAAASIFFQNFKFPAENCRDYIVTPLVPGGNLVIWD